MTCQEWFDQLYLILDRELDRIEWDEVEEHMKHCRPCYDRYEIENKIRERLRESCRREICSEALRLKIQAIIERY